jgi:Ion transport protein
VESSDEDGTPQIHFPAVLKNIALWVVYYAVGIILPDGYFRATWDLIIAMLLAYISIVLPYTIAFKYDDGVWSDSCPESWPWRPDVEEPLDLTSLNPGAVVQYAVDAIFAMDIMCVLFIPILACCAKLCSIRSRLVCRVNFRTAYVDEDACLVVSRSAIMRHYLRTWFVFDIISVFPFDLLLASNALGVVHLVKTTRLVKIAKVLRLLRVVKMLKLLRAPRVFTTLEAIVGKAVVSMVSFCFGILLVTHSMACMFYFVAQSYVRLFWIRPPDLFTLHGRHLPGQQRQARLAGILPV